MGNIRRLRKGEAALYRSIRLESLKESPAAFASTYESALIRDDESWAAQADAASEGHDRAIFMAFADRPVGLAGLYRIGDSPSVGELIQMWIAPDYRGGSLAAALLDHLFEWASRHQFRSVQAEVAEGNPRALHFYEKYGFRRLESGLGGRLLTKKVGQKPDHRSATLLP